MCLRNLFIFLIFVIELTWSKESSNEQTLQPLAPSSYRGNYITKTQDASADDNADLGFILCFFFQNCDKADFNKIRDGKASKKKLICENDKRSTKNSIINRSPKRNKKTKLKKKLKRKKINGNIQMLILPKFYINLNLERDVTPKHKYKSNFINKMLKKFQFLIMKTSDPQIWKPDRKEPIPHLEFPRIRMEVHHQISFTENHEAGRVGISPRIKLSSALSGREKTNRRNEPMGNSQKEQIEVSRTDWKLTKQNTTENNAIEVESNSSSTLEEKPTSNTSSMKRKITSLIQALRNISIHHEYNAKVAVDDKCVHWGATIEGTIQNISSMSLLPSCPCTYPFGIVYGEKIFDSSQKDFYSWQVLSTKLYSHVLFKWSNACIQTAGLEHEVLSAQVCCYDRFHKLITRGSGAGFPLSISPEISDVLHQLLDYRPWKICQGNFERFHRVRTPNNGNDCPGNPDKAIYDSQRTDAYDY